MNASSGRAPHQPPATVTAGGSPSRGAQCSRAARERAELALTPAERLTLALELSDLCADLAAAGRRALEERP
jgi:hypothetical protein